MNKILTFVLDTVEPEIAPVITEFVKGLEEAGHIVKEIRQITDKGEIKLKVPTAPEVETPDADTELANVPGPTAANPPVSGTTVLGSTTVPSQSALDAAGLASEEEFYTLSTEDQAAVLADEEARVAMAGYTPSANVNSGSSPNPLGSIPTV